MINLTNTSSHIFIVHFSSLFLSFLLSFIIIMLARDPSSPVASTSGLCVPNPFDDVQFYSFYVTFTIAMSVLWLLLLLILVQFSRKNFIFLRIQIRATLFSLTVFCLIFNTILYFYLHLHDVQYIIDAIFCTITHTRQNNPPCGSTDIAPEYIFNVILYAITPTFEVLFISLSYKATWQW